MRRLARWPAVGLVGAAFVLASCASIAQAQGDWRAAPTRPGFFPAQRALALKDGRILVVSWGTLQTPAEVTEDQIFDPSIGRWRPAADYPPGFTPGPGVLLRDGSVIFAPGQPGEAPARYLPDANRWVLVTRMPMPTVPNAILLLPSGKVIALGGYGAQGPQVPIEVPQVYDPATGTWSVDAPMHDARIGLAAIMLADGTVLVVGGTDVSQTPVVTAERYDPLRNTWSLAGNEKVPSFAPAGARLPDGRLLIVTLVDPFGGGAYNQIYDPRTNAWQFGPSQPSAGGGPVVALADGRILLLKATFNRNQGLYRAEILDPRTMAWSASPVHSGELNPGSAVVALRDGRALAISQRSDSLYDPNAMLPPQPGLEGLGSPQLSVILGGIAALLAMLVLGQYVLTHARERRRLATVKL